MAKIFFKKNKIDGKFFINKKNKQISFVVKKKSIPKTLLKKIKIKW